MLRILDAYPKFLIARTRHDEYQYNRIRIVDIGNKEEVIMLKQIVFILLALCLGLTACAGGRQQKGGTAKNAPGKAALEKVKTETVHTKGEAAMGKEHVGNVLSIKLNSGYAMPVLGLGTWSQNNQTAAESVYTALKLGYRLIDTARYYGNERGVGEGVKRAIAEGIIKREEVFITSKIMPGNYDNAAAAIDASLKDLGVAYLDLMLIHQPGSNDRAVYQAMEQAVKKGKIRSIGISNYYTKQQVDEVLSYAKIVPAVIQNENHIYYQNTALMDYVKPYGTAIECWYPFGGRGNTRDSFENKTIVGIAEKHKKTPAQIILRWQVQAGYVTIPGSADPKHIAENINVFDFELSPDEMKEIAALDRQRRYENW